MRTLNNLEPLAEKVANSIWGSNNYYNNDYIILPKSFIKEYQEYLKFKEQLDKGEIHINFNSGRCIQKRTVPKKYLMLI